MNVSLTLKSGDVQKAIAAARTRAPNAIARALNRAIASANTVMVRACATDLGLKQADVKRFIVVRNASPTKLEASIVASGARIPLMKFGARFRLRSGVTARLPGGAGRYPHAFIATMASGHQGVFQRRGRARFPIRELYGPSLPHVFGKHIDAGLARGEEQLVKNLIHELRFAATQQLAA